VNESVEPRVVDTARLQAAGDDIRLNLGCGHIPLQGYVNVDVREVPGVDVVAEVGRLPFQPGEVAEIRSAHMLEHFPVEELTRSLLPYWYSLLRPGGLFVAVVPDADTMLAEHAAGRLSFDELREVTFGGQEYEGDFHFNMFSHTSLCELLEKVGFSDVELREAGRRNGICYEMEVVARKPQDGVPARS
jgi:SAM-dependent methyltransferase